MSKKIQWLIYAFTRSMKDGFYRIDFRNEKGFEIIDFYDTGVIMSHKRYNKDGKQNGLSEDYYLNGKVNRKAYFIKGRMSGEVRVYYENGKLKQACRYRKGHPIGRIRLWDNSGKLIVQEKNTRGHWILKRS
jgi:antitoxin component YwqK of YwqJK toxin-antitoxin module